MILIYDEIIEKLKSMTNEKEVLPNPEKSWGEADASFMLFPSDTLYELGTSKYAFSTILYTDKPDITKDEIFLIGNDINQSTKDTNYARVVVLKIKEDGLGQGPKMYQNIRKLDYTKYHIYPENVMIRISQMNQRESIRVGKKAKNIRFSDLGKIFIDAYKSHPMVEYCQIYFITKDGFDYEGLQSLSKKSESITLALDHLVNQVNMDCHSCSLQQVCEEVENKIKEDFNEEE